MGDRKRPTPPPTGAVKPEPPPAPPVRDLTSALQVLREYVTGYDAGHEPRPLFKVEAEALLRAAVEERENDDSAAVLAWLRQNVAKITTRDTEGVERSYEAFNPDCEIVDGESADDRDVAAIARVLMDAARSTPAANRLSQEPPSA